MTTTSSIRRSRPSGPCARALAVLLLPLLASAPARAPEDVALDRVAGDFTLPVYVIGDPDDVGRLFVIELPGVIRLLVDDVPNKAPFLDIRRRVAVPVGEDDEFGLFTMAFDPGWPKKRYVYVNYTNLAGDTVVSRFTINKKLTRAKKGSERVLLTVVQPQPWHNGGQINFGPDGNLYIGMGDGGDDFDTGAAGQDLNTPLGKLLRYELAKNGLRVPADNPALPGVGRTAFWAIGLRNPWRFSFDRETGDLYLGDVGEDAREEIDFEEAGSAGGTNFGWPVMEGTRPYNGAVAPATVPLTPPIFEYDHDSGRSVTGGYVYRGAAIPALAGYYVFADWATSRVAALRMDDGTVLAAIDLSDVLRTAAGDTPTVSSFGEDAAGELYLCDFFAGVVYRLVPAG